MRQLFVDEMNSFTLILVFLATYKNAIMLPDAVKQYSNISCGPFPRANTKIESNCGKRGQFCVAKLQWVSFVKKLTEQNTFSLLYAPDTNFKF